VFLFSFLMMPLISISQTDSPKIIDINKAAFKIIAIGDNPDFLATDEDNAWVIDDGHSKIHKISPTDKTPMLTIAIPQACTAPVVGFNSVWVMSCSEKKLYRIDNTTGRILAKISTGLADKNGEMSLSTGDGAIWLLSDSAGILVRINPKTNSIEKKITVRPHSYCTAYGFNSVWITNYVDNSVQKIDPATNSVTATIAVGAKPRFLTVGEHGVWTLNQGDGTVSKIDPLLNKTVATINVKAVGNGGDITSGAGKIWVVSTNVERPVQIINPLTDSVEIIYSQNPVAGKKFKVDGAARSSKSYVWVSGYYSKTVWVFKK